MKTFIATIIALFVITLSVNAQNTKIDFDYSKAFNVDYIFLDYNGNQQVDLDEGEWVTPTEKSKFTVTLEYKDFSSAGNLLKVEIRCSNTENGKSLLVKGNFEDIYFEQNKDSEQTAWFVINKLGELEFLILTQDGKTSVSVFNVARMKIIK